MSEVAKGLEYLHAYTPTIIHGDVRGVSLNRTSPKHLSNAKYSG